MIILFRFEKPDPSAGMVAIHLLFNFCALVVKAFFAELVRVNFDHVNRAACVRLRLQNVSQVHEFQVNEAIQLQINNSLYQLSREGRWFKFSLLTKKHTVKRTTIFETITELYNQAVHGHTWEIKTAH